MINQHKNINLFKFFPVTIPVYIDTQQHHTFTENFTQLFNNINDYITNDSEIIKVKNNTSYNKFFKESSSKKESVIYNSLFRFRKNNL